jgi:hypothetical protein
MMHFYHNFTGPGSDWHNIVEEHFTELARVGYDGNMKVMATQYGYEDVTLNVLRDWAQTADPDEPVFYAHAKGSTRPSGLQDAWRRSMLQHCGTNWRQRVEELSYGNDVSCWWWSKAADYPAHASGNFWWARAGYLAGLPALNTLDSDTRWNAEFWIGTGNPTVVAPHKQVGTPIVDMAMKWPPPSLEDKERELGLR